MVHLDQESATIYSFLLAAATAAGYGIRHLIAWIRKEVKTHPYANPEDFNSIAESLKIISTNGYLKKKDLEDWCEKNHTFIKEKLLEHEKGLLDGNTEFNEMHRQIGEMHEAFVGDYKTPGLRARVEFLERDKEERNKNG